MSIPKLKRKCMVSDLLLSFWDCQWQTIMRTQWKRQTWMCKYNLTILITLVQCMVISLSPSLSYINVQYFIAVSAGSTNRTDAQLSRMEICKSDLCSKVCWGICFGKCSCGSQLYRAVVYTPVKIPDNCNSLWFAFLYTPGLEGGVFPSSTFVFIFILETFSPPVLAILLPFTLFQSQGFSGGLSSSSLPDKVSALLRSQQGCD